MVPGDVLRMIEDASNDDPIELQNGFTAYSDCSSISTIKNKTIKVVIRRTLLTFLENEDECVTASEIYSCGREKEPNLVNAILTSEKGNATVVCNIKKKCYQSNFTIKTSLNIRSMTHQCHAYHILASHASLQKARLLASSM
jgi:hypothetical protein